MLRRAPYWAWDRQGVKIPLTDILDTVNPKTVLDYGSGNGRGADVLRTRDLSGQVRVDCYDPAWPGSERVPTGTYDMVIAYNLLNNVEPSHVDVVCEHINSLVGKDLILAIVIPVNFMHDNLINVWINKFPQLKLSYSSVGPTENTIGIKGQPVAFLPLFIWLYREPEEVVVVPPRVRLKKKGT